VRRPDRTADQGGTAHGPRSRNDNSRPSEKRSSAGADFGRELDILNLRDGLATREGADEHPGGGVTGHRWHAEGSGREPSDESGDDHQDKIRCDPNGAAARHLAVN
jgi:hypothetical protein